MLVFFFACAKKVYLGGRRAQKPLIAQTAENQPKNRVPTNFMESSHKLHREFPQTLLGVPTNYLAVSRKENFFHTAVRISSLSVQDFLFNGEVKTRTNRGKNSDTLCGLRKMLYLCALKLLDR